MKNKYVLGQYFTTNTTLKEKVYEFILNNPANILEPSIGQGDLVLYIQDKLPEIVFDMYEIDENIKLLDDKLKDRLVYGDFLLQNISKNYDCIVGNPPYIKQNNKSMYIEFVEKCFNILRENGELIFIVPADFLKLTSARNILNTMMTNGTFTHIYHPHNENLFENAKIDIIIFRYCKNKLLEKKTLYNNEPLFISNNDGLITFHVRDMSGNSLFTDYFTICVGLVSGKEEVYKNEKYGNIDVINGENVSDKYIYIDKYPCDNDELNEYLLQYKDILINRGIRKFNNNNWYEWGALRNIKTITENIGRDCIYIHNLTRKSKVGFIGKVSYFGGGLIMLIPKKPCDLQKIVSYINSDLFKTNYIFSGRFKIGHRQISNSYLVI